MKLFSVITISVFALLAAHCGSVQIPPENPDSLTKIIELTKGPCFGKCPMYTITIYSNGLAAFDGKRFTEKEGLHYKDIGRAKAKEIKNAAKAADFFVMEDDYPNKVTDISTHTIVYHEGSRSKTVKGNINLPQGAKDVIKILDGVAEGKGWIKK